MDGSLVSLPVTAVAASGTAADSCRADVLGLFQKLLPLEFFLAAMKRAKVRESNRVYSSPVVLWLMICQRLQAQGTLEIAVLELVSGLPRSFWPHPCKRLEHCRGGRAEVVQGIRSVQQGPPGVVAVGGGTVL